MQKPATGEMPHVIWCVTGALTFLPIHAAGPYDARDRLPRVFDLVVSSYTPTITALLNANEQRVSQPHRQEVRVLGVSQPATPNFSALPCTKDEVDKIKRLCEGSTSRFGLQWLDDKEATVDAVLHGMKEHQWVHLACHGIQNRAESAFILADGRLTLQRIMKESFTHTELAVLSACETAMGDAELKEEAIHLAAGMLMAGYGSVVATMWSIADADGPVIAEKLYAYLMNEANGDSTKTAYALHHAVSHLRERVGEKNFARWVPFIHLGI